MVKCHCIFTRPLLFTLSSDPAPGPCSAASKRGFSLPFPASWASPPAQPPRRESAVGPRSAQSLARAAAWEPQQGKTFELLSVSTGPQKAQPAAEPGPAEPGPAEPGPAEPSRTGGQGAGAAAQAELQLLLLSARVLVCLIWAFLGPITYYKQFSLSLSESLSKLAT